MALRSSLDGFSSDLASWEQVGEAVVQQTVLFTSLATITDNIEFRIFSTSNTSANNGVIANGGTFRVQNFSGPTNPVQLLGTITPISTETIVSFGSPTGTALESSGTFNLPISILTPSTTNTTTVTLELTGGNPDLTSNFAAIGSTFDVVIPANTTSFNFPLDINDNATCDGDAALQFTITSVTGGEGSATIGTQDVFDLTVTDDEASMTTIAFQGFETGDTWSYTLSTPECINGAGNDVWSVVSSLLSFNPAAGENFFGIRDLEGDCGGASFETITLSNFATAGFTNMVISFDYNVFGFDGGDDIEYALVIDGVSQGNVLLVDGNSNFTTPGWQTATIPIPGSPNTVGLQIRIDQNGNDDYAGIDNIRLESSGCLSCTNPPNPIATLNIGATTTTTANVSWADIPGDKNLLLAAEGTLPDYTPLDETLYPHSAQFGNSDPFGNGYFVHNSADNSASLTNLTPGTLYGLELYGYNCLPYDEQYSSASVSGYMLTNTDNPTSFSVVCADATSIELSWINPTSNYDGVVILARPGAVPNSVASIDPSSLCVSANIGFCTPYAGDSKVVYNGTGQSVTVTGLTPGQSYTFVAQSYVDLTSPTSIFKYSGGTQVTQVAGPTEVSNVQAFSFSPNEIILQWQNPDAACFDQILVAVQEGLPVLGSPTESDYLVNSSNFPDVSNPSLSDGSKVLYFGTGSTTSIEQLDPSEEYCMKVFTYYDGNWSNGIEVCRFPGTGTLLNPGDLVFIGIDTYISTGTDKISLLSLKEITTGTSFNISNMVYEWKAPANVSTGRWYNGNGNLSFAPPFATITYIGTETLPAGSVWCFELVGSGNIGSTNFLLNGSLLDPSDYSVSYQSGESIGYTAISQSAPDAIFLSQGVYSQPQTDEDGDLYVTFTGNVLGAFHSRANFLPITVAGNQGGSRVSREYPGMDCFNISFSSNLSRYFAHYDGDTYTGSQYSLLGEITDFTNWESGQGGDSDDLPESFCATTFTVSSQSTPGMWKGFNTDWFDCINWDNFAIPTSQTDVELPVTAFHPVIDGPGAVCNDLNIANGSSIELGTISATLGIYGDVILDGAFDAFTGTVSFLGSANQSLTYVNGMGPSTINAQNLIIDKPGGRLLVEGNIQVEGELSLQRGIIDLITPEALVQFTVTSTVIGGSELSFINGPAVRTGFEAAQEFIFPVGYFEPGNPIYQPASLTSVANIGSGWKVQYFHENYNTIFPNPASPPVLGLNAVSTCNYWLIDRTFGTDPIRVGLSWNEANCFDVTDPDALTVARFNSLADEWEDAPFTPGVTQTNSGDPYVTGWVKTTQTVNNFSPFAIGAIGNNLNVLPITLLSFTAQATGKNLVETQWSTASETNNDYFTIERSRDAAFWEPIGFVPGAGNSNTTRYYSLSDDAPFPGLSYYRLKQTDFDGSFAYSYVVPVQIDHFGADLALIQAYRDVDKLALLYTAESPQIRVELYSVVGQKLHSINVENTDGFVRINLPQLAHGVYIVRISSGTDMATAKFFY